MDAQSICWYPVTPAIFARMREEAVSHADVYKYILVHANGKTSAMVGGVMIRLAGVTDPETGRKHVIHVNARLATADLVHGMADWGM